MSCQHEFNMLLKYKICRPNDCKQWLKRSCCEETGSLKRHRVWNAASGLRWRRGYCTSGSVRGDPLFVRATRALDAFIVRSHSFIQSFMWDIIPIMKMHNNQLNLIVFIFSQSEIKTFNCHISGWNINTSLEKQSGKANKSLQPR